eukprot:1152316-Pelagomonas_calceolata.AAC.10
MGCGAPAMLQPCAYCGCGPPNSSDWAYRAEAPAWILKLLACRMSKGAMESRDCSENPCCCSKTRGKAVNEI